VTKVEVTKQETASQSLGVEVHRQLEEYYLSNAPLDYTTPAGYIAAEIQKHLPPRSPVTSPEQEFLLKSKNHKYYGLIDLRTPTHVYDHKTTSDLKWAKKDLETDVQAILYATTYLVDYPEAPGVFVQWTYGQTRGTRKSLPVRQYLPREIVALAFEETERVADEMDATKTVPSLQVPYNATACRAYNTLCPFASHCNLTAEDTLRSIMSTTSTDSLLTRLSKRQAINPPPVHDTQPAPPIPPVQDPPEFKPEPPTQAETPIAKSTAPTTKPLIGWLFVGCEPSGKKAVRFEQVLTKACAIVTATKLKDDQGSLVTDYRQVPYGKGPAALLQAIKQVVEAAEHTALLVVTYPSTPEAQIALNYLSSIADIVIRTCG
jgi:hypothetical protein